MRALLMFPATSYRPEPFVAAAEALGVELCLATDLPAAARRFGREVIQVDFAAPRGARAPAVDGVVAVDERSAVVAAAIAAAQPGCRPYHSLEGVLAARDKRRMRERLHARGVPAPHATT